MRQHLTKSRYRFRKSDGSPDLTALKTYVHAVRHAPDLTAAQKSNLAKTQQRMFKSAEANDGRLPAINFDGVWVFLDRPKGTVEQGVGADGQPWERTFLCNYGFFPDTVGADNEPVDVFVGDDVTSPTAYLVKQVFQDGSFDEFKVLIGFKSAEEAMRMYFAHVPAWCFGGVSELPFSFLVQLIGCAPDTVSMAMQKSVYVKLPGILWNKIGMQRVDKAEWSAARVNGLKDDAFLFIEPGGTKDEEGKTKPRSLRHFPYKNEHGTIDLPHLRNAIARIPQSGSWLSQAEKDRLQAKARTLLEGQTKTRMKSLVKSACLASIPVSIRKALDSIGATYSGPTIPITPTSDLASHPALTSPITWDYDYPEQVGGWIGGIEPENEEWIAFVDVLGHCLLWTTREPRGGVVGIPYSFDRPDLAVVEHTVESVESDLNRVRASLATPLSILTSATNNAPIPPQEHLPSGTVVTQPGQPSEIIKDTVSVASVPVQQPEVDSHKQRVPRSLFAKDKYDGIDFTPPKAVRAAFKRGLELHAEGFSGDGLQADTLAWSRRLSRGEKISPAKVTQGNAWFARHESDRKPNWATEKTPGYVAWMNWGGDPGKAWMGKLKRQMDARDSLQKSVDGGPARAWVEREIERDEEKRLVFGVVLEPEPFDGGGDAHGHTYSEEEVQQAAYDYLAYFRNLTDNHNHSDACREGDGFAEGVCTCGAYLPADRAVVVESYCTPIEFTINGVVIKRGSWMLRVHVIDDALWAKVLAGEWNAFSIEGIGDLISLDEEEE